MNTCTELIPRLTLAAMVGTYRQAETDIRAAFAMLTAAEENLKKAFTVEYGFDLDGHIRNRYLSFKEPAKLMHELKKDAWRVLVDRMELKRILSIKRTEELNAQLEKGTDLPEIEEAQILAMIEGTLAQAGTMIEEATREVFEWLTPQRGWDREYKTNSHFQIGPKVIRGYCVERWHSNGHPYHVNYHRESNLRALDNVMHALDGHAGDARKTHGGPLCDAINMSTDGTGETTYFRFRCFKNGNLHLEFRRLDLVEKLNAVAGGMTLKPKTP